MARRDQTLRLLLRASLLQKWLNASEAPIDPTQPTVNFAAGRNWPYRDLVVRGERPEVGPCPSGPIPLVDVMHEVVRPLLLLRILTASIFFEFALGLPAIPFGLLFSLPLLAFFADPRGRLIFLSVSSVCSCQNLWRS